MDTTIVTQLPDSDPQTPPPHIRYYRIPPMQLGYTSPIPRYPQDNTFYIADGVYEVDGGAWLGQVRGNCTVAPFINPDGLAFPAPDDWYEQAVPL